MKSHIKNHRYKMVRLMIGVTILSFVSIGVGCNKRVANQDIVFTTGLGSKELFKIGKNTCSLSEAKFLFQATNKQYELIFDQDNWEKQFGDGTVEEYIKQQVLMQLSQIKSLDLMADKYKIELETTEKHLIQSATADLLDSFTDAQLKEIGIKTKDVENLYEQYARSQKVYQKIIDEVDTEISDDEARVIRVQQILFKTYQEDDKGKKVKVSQEELTALREQATQVLQRVNNLEDFESLASEFTQDSKTQYTIARGIMPEELEEVAFNLKNNDVSPVVETQYGLHILKCISNYEQSETEENKRKIYEERCKELFNKKYDAFMKTISVEMNDKSWKKVSLDTGKKQETKDFFEVYLTYFKPL